MQEPVVVLLESGKVPSRGVQLMMAQCGDGTRDKSERQCSGIYVPVETF